MRFIPVFLLFLLLQFFMISNTPVYAGPAIADPHIPDGEKITYLVTIGEESYPLVQRTVRKTENNRDLYEITTESVKEDLFIRIDCKKMVVVSSRGKSKRPEYIVERETRIIKNEIPVKEGEFVIIDFSGLNQVLRGFPFEKTKSLKIKSAGDSTFSIIVKMKNQTKVKTKMGEIACYKLELGMDGFWGAFFPKTYFWYSVDAPHYLVQYKGQEGGPGSSQMTIELTGYESE